VLGATGFFYDDKTTDLDGWVTVVNGSEMPFKNASLQRRKAFPLSVMP
jgi:hypothetical protein